MILSLLLSVSFTFSVTATGVEKGTPIEFVFAGPNTDRAYESMFILDEPISSLCRRLETTVPRGKPVNIADNWLWPSGCRVRFEPSLSSYVMARSSEGDPPSVPVYTGGARRSDDSLYADDTMPAAFFSTYSFSQAPIVFNVPVDQGSSYGRFTSALKLDKGAKFTFSIIIDETSLPKKVDLKIEKGNLTSALQILRLASVSQDIDATVSFSDALTVEEAVSFSQALSVVDSSRVRINGSCGLFYRAFLPLEKWRDRQERLHQPFELNMLDNGTETLVHIDEDWNVEGIDPKLTPREISFPEASKFLDVDTCFIYVSKTQLLSRVSSAIKRLNNKRIVNWYVFPSNCTSLHNLH